MSEDAPLLKPTEFPIEDADGKKRVYILSNFPAVIGREIVMKYPLSAIPKLADYEVNKDVMLKLMHHVAVDNNGQLLRLSTQALIDNHVPDYEVLLKIEMAMMEKNCSFFRNGKSWDFLENLAQVFLQRTTEMLTRLSEQSSPVEKPASTSSEQSTT
jgi:hypothetical protein